MPWREIVKVVCTFTSRYFQYLDLAGIPEVALGSERANPAFEPPPPPPFMKRFSWLLPGALALVILVFDLLLGRIVRSLNRRSSLPPS